MKIRAAAIILLLALAAVSGACRGGKHAASPTAAVTAEQTPPDVVEGAPTPVHTPSSVIGPISQEEAFGKYLSEASAFEIDLRTKQIYVYIGNLPEDARPRDARAAVSLISADRVWNAVAGGSREIVVSRRGSGPAYRITTPGQAAWSPTTHSLAFGSNVCGGGQLQLLDVDTGAVRNLTPEVRGALGYAWSADGALIAVEVNANGGPFEILLLDVAAGTSESLVQVPAARGGEFAPVAFDAGGGRLGFTYIPGRDFCQEPPPPTKLERLP